MRIMTEERDRDSPVSSPNNIDLGKRPNSKFFGNSIPSHLNQSKIETIDLSLNMTKELDITPEDEKKQLLDENSPLFKDSIMEKAMSHGCDTTRETRQQPR